MIWQTIDDPGFGKHDQNICIIESHYQLKIKTMITNKKLANGTLIEQIGIVIHKIK